MDVCITEAKGDIDAGEVTGARLAVTRAWVFLSEVTCLPGVAL